MMSHDKVQFELKGKRERGVLGSDTLLPFIEAEKRVIDVRVLLVR